MIRKTVYKIGVLMISIGYLFIMAELSLLYSTDGYYWIKPLTECLFCRGWPTIILITILIIGGLWISFFSVIDMLDELELEERAKNV